MSSPKPGQIRCPTCHRSTAPAAFCTHCGSPIPSSAVTRPRGMDRDELDARIRGRRVDPAFRRGAYADEWGDPDVGGYAPFQPEPEDALAVRTDAPDAAQAPRVDHMRDEPPPPPAAAPADPWRRGREVPEPEPEPEPPGSLVPPLPPFDPTPPVVADEVPAPIQHDPWAGRAAEVPPPIDEGPYAAADDDEGWPAEEAYYVPAHDDDDRRGGSSVLPIVGFVALGVIALLVGVFFSNLFSSDEPVAQVTPTPSVAASSAAAAPTDSAAPSSAGPSTSGQPNASGGPPITFPDGFIATTQPCVSQPNASGCNSDGATNSGSIWVYISFEKGQRDDVLGMTILDAAGAVVAQASIELAQVNCPADVACNGWILFPGFGTPYSDLESGDYKIRINRNGLPAAEADFTVT